MRLKLVTILLSSAAVATAGVALARAAAPGARPAPPVTAAAQKSPARQIVATRRITESQYLDTVHDIFGRDIQVNGHFEPERREDGLLAIGATQLSISGVGFEQYYSMARSVADQVFDDKRRARVTTCKPADARAADPACVEPFVRQYGRRLFGRPLSEAEVRARLATAGKGAATAGDHYAGMKLALVSLLTAPDFLFHVERAEPDPARPGELRYDAATKAQRLSYMLWDAAPDAELLRSAEAGELHTPEGLRAQVARLTASPRLEAGARAFFADMLQLELFDNLTKDTTVYPKFSAGFMADAREETLKTLVDLLLVQKGDYRDIFTTRTTFVTRRLAAVYQTPYLSQAAWTKHTAEPGAEAAGLLTQATFLTLHSHPGRTSPTKRGVALNQIFLCSPTPPPPPDVDFSKVQDSSAGTVRGRLLDHMNNPGCAGCHRTSDPAGLALERFDSIGQRRTMENGAVIDVSAELSGKTFSGAAELGALLHANPRAPACLVRNVFAYGVGRAPESDEDEAYLKAQAAAFAKGGYRYPDLLAEVARSDAFFRVVKPKAPPAPPAPAPKTKVAAHTAPTPGGAP